MELAPLRLNVTSKCIKPKFCYYVKCETSITLYCNQVREVHSIYALFGLGGTSASLSGKRVSDDITLNLHTDVCS
ncbi:hypothetical protein EV363DRAFT_1170623, partial [Boletus edulis]